MNRRGFIKRLLGGLAAVLGLAPNLAKADPHPLEAGYIYHPYIPLAVTKSKYMLEVERMGLDPKDELIRLSNEIYQKELAGLSRQNNPVTTISDRYPRI